MSGFGCITGQSPHLLASVSPPTQRTGQHVKHLHVVGTSGTELLASPALPPQLQARELQTPVSCLPWAPACPLHQPWAPTLDLGLNRPMQVREGHQQPLPLSQLCELQFQLRDGQPQIGRRLLQALLLPLQALQQLLKQNTGLVLAQATAPGSTGDTPSCLLPRQVTGLQALSWLEAPLVKGKRVPCTLTLPSPTCWAWSWHCLCSFSLCTLCSCSSMCTRWASASSRLPRSSSRSWSRLSSCCSRARCLACRD